MLSRDLYKKLALFFSLMVLSSVAVYSQAITTSTESDNPNNIEEVADQALKVNIEVLPQQYPSKNIGFRLTVKSEVDSGRVAIQWYYPTSLLNVVDTAKDNVTIVADKEFVTEKYFTPRIIPGQKTYTQSFSMAVKVSALTYEQNYLTTIKANYIIDSEYQILPLTDSYRQAKTEYEVTRLVINLLIAGVIMFVVSIALGRFLAYVNSEDIEK